MKKFFIGTLAGSLLLSAGCYSHYIEIDSALDFYKRDVPFEVVSQETFDALGKTKPYDLTKIPVVLDIENLKSESDEFSHGTWLCLLTLGIIPAPTSYSEWEDKVIVQSPCESKSTIVSSGNTYWNGLFMAFCPHGFKSSSNLPKSLKPSSLDWHYATRISDKFRGYVAPAVAQQLSFEKYVAFAKEKNAVYVKSLEEQAQALTREMQTLKSEADALAQDVRKEMSTIQIEAEDSTAISKGIREASLLVRDTNVRLKVQAWQNETVVERQPYSSEDEWVAAAVVKKVTAVRNKVLKPRRELSESVAQTGEGLVTMFAEQYMPNAYAHYDTIKQKAFELQENLNEIFPMGEAIDAVQIETYRQAVDKLIGLSSEYAITRDELVYFYIAHRIGILSGAELTEFDAGRLAVPLLPEAMKYKHPPVSARGTIDDKQLVFAESFMPETYAAYQKVNNAILTRDTLFKELYAELQQMDDVRPNKLIVLNEAMLQDVLALQKSLRDMITDKYTKHRLGTEDADAILAADSTFASEVLADYDKRMKKYDLSVKHLSNYFFGLAADEEVGEMATEHDDLTIQTPTALYNKIEQMQVKYAAVARKQEMRDAINAEIKALK